MLRMLYKNLRPQKNHSVAQRVGVEQRKRPKNVR